MQVLGIGAGQAAAPLELIRFLSSVNFYLKSGILPISVAAYFFIYESGYPEGRGLIHDVEPLILGAYPDGVVPVGSQAAGELAGVFLGRAEDGKSLAFRIETADDL